MARVVLVTGVSSPLAAGVAQALSAEPGVRRVIGADSSPPPRADSAPRASVGGGDAPRGVEYVHVDLHDESLGQIVADSGAEVILHLGLDTARAPHREDTLLGTMRVLAAAQRSPRVQRVVVRSSASLDSDDAAEVERDTLGLQRRRPDVSVAVLRLANLIGPSVDTPLTRYLGARFVPTVLGRDPNVRFVHEDDAAEALVRMALSDETGHFDVAGADSVPLSDCLRRVGGQRLPVPARGLKVLRSMAKHGRIDYASSTRAVSAGRLATGMDTAPLEKALDWSPSYSSPQAFETFVGSRAQAAPTRGAGLRPVHVLALARATLGR
ncbi:NAD-dependent epimerase/dehydratase family protein [Nocardiopsis sp. YSL2]|uniref:NAD-dependent epimerase/dehydratase family protein n=1 Tax=Nocardiopsis sp. YSL2 TaxID=2939492 RepID=UPI0026F4198C|nr:NAD-dependent epimerase/dehydratase family protein [Nocardiopsis sp. YSL2]